MGICRDSRHKRRETGGKRHCNVKKRKFELGRPGAFTKLGTKRIHLVRCRGGAQKYRAIRLDTGNFSWASETLTRKTRVADVLYNASNNELVRTKTLVKGAVIQIDALPFRQWYEKHYGVEVGKKMAAKKKDDAEEEEEKPKSRHALQKRTTRQKGRVLEQAILDQFNSGRLLARIASRPGQSGRCDGYILEGKELEFYQKQLQKKKTK
jgi:small subunit ribosomal protein S8e